MTILVIGYGSIAKKHLHALKVILHKSKFIIYALRSCENYADTTEIISIRSLDEIEKNITFVMICNPTSSHYSSIKKVLHLNCPIFIEKPPFCNLSEAINVSCQIENLDIFTYVACNFRFHPCIQYLKKELFNTINSINEVNVYCGSYLPEWRPGRDYKEIYSSIKSLGGGVHLDLYHEFDYAFWLFGNPLNVSGRLSSKSTLGIETADYANYLLEYENFNLNIVLNYFRREPKRTIEIVTDCDVFKIDLLAATISNMNNKELFRDKNYTVFDTYKKQLLYFLSTIKRGGKKSMNSVESSLDVLKIIFQHE